MKRFVPAILIAAFLLTSCGVANLERKSVQNQENPDSLSVIHAPWKWSTTASGVTTGYATFPLFGKQASISVAHYPAASLSLSVAYNTGSECLTTSQAGLREGAKAAINGSYFNMTTLVATTFYATGGKIICGNALDTRTNGIVGISDGGHTVEILEASTYDFDSYAAEYSDVLASGPVLMQHGKIVLNPGNDFNDTSHPRSIIGKDADGEIWMIVIDGRFEGLGEGATINECSLICRYLGLTDAINLDGGGSSSVWTPETGTINHPCDNKQWDHLGERKDPTIFIAK